MRPFVVSALTVIQSYPGIVGGDEKLGGVSSQELHARYLLPGLLPAPLVLHICKWPFPLQKAVGVCSCIDCVAYRRKQRMHG